jgi:cytochrome c-type biogenesis protein CcmE
MRKRNLKFVVGGVILIIAISYLIFTGIQKTALYYLTVSELNDRGPSLAHEESVRVNGRVLDGSIQWDSKDHTLNFIITDGENKLPIIHQGIAPDTFKDGAEVVVQGRYTPEDVFEADKIMAKCPSKYEAQ